MAFYNEMLAGFWHILKAPFVDLSALWLLAPLIIMWAVLELYFDLHKNEELGWNTALGNGISMFWISVNIMRYLFTENMEKFTWPRMVIISLLLLYSFFIAYISFSHKLSPKLTFKLASPTPVYYFSGIVILWAFGALKLSLWIIIDIIIIFGLLLLLVALLRKVLPERGDDEGLEESSSPEEIS
ncbi:MAG: hypothetical protein R6U32_00475 [Candidatus Woesearchaeota archaeon]